MFELTRKKRKRADQLYKQMEGGGQAASSEPHTTPVSTPERRKSLIWQDTQPSSGSPPLNSKRIDEAAGAAQPEEGPGDEEEHSSDGEENSHLHKSGSAKLDQLLIKEGVVGPVVQGNCLGYF